MRRRASHRQTQIAVCRRPDGQPLSSAAHAKCRQALVTCHALGWPALRADIQPQAQALRCVVARPIQVLPCAERALPVDGHALDRTQSRAPRRAHRTGRLPPVKRTHTPGSRPRSLISSLSTRCISRWSMTKPNAPAPINVGWMQVSPWIICSTCERMRARRVRLVTRVSSAWSKLPWSARRLPTARAAQTGQGERWGLRWGLRWGFGLISHVPINSLCRVSQRATL